MARFKYHNDWQISHQFDCNFWVSSRDLKDALCIAALKDDDAHIAVHADCEFDGIKAVANVGIYVRDARGKSIDKIFGLLDKEVDDYIARRVKTGHWTEGNKI